MASIEERGDSTRVTWLLGGQRGGAKQSCTFSGPVEGRHELANAAKALIEVRGHRISRPEVYRIILGENSGNDEAVMLTFKAWSARWIQDRLEAAKADPEADPDGILREQRVLQTRGYPFLGGLLLTEINHENLQAWISWLLASKKFDRPNLESPTERLNPNTIRQFYRIVSTCLSAAVPKYISYNPAARPRGRKDVVHLPKSVPHESAFMSPSQLKMVLEQCVPDLWDIVYVTSRSGLRMGEAITLQIGNIVFPRIGGATILVRHNRKKSGRIGAPKSKAGRRAIPVEKRAAEVLRKRCLNKRPTDLVFLTPTGRPWTPSTLRDKYWYRAVACASRCAEHPPPLPPAPKRGPRRGWRNSEVSTCACETRLHIRPRFHDIRHSHVAYLIECGWPPKKIQVRIGHSDFLTTMNVYGHLMDLGSADELTSLEDFLLDDPSAPSSSRVAAPTAGRRVARSVQRRVQRAPVRPGVSRR